MREFHRTRDGRRGNPCNDGQCQEGTCLPLPTPGICDDDGNECTNDLCDDGSCVHPPLDGATCQDDDDLCTDDICDNAVCTHPQKCPISDGPCEKECCGSGVCYTHVKPMQPSISKFTSGIGCPGSTVTLNGVLCNTGPCDRSFDLTYQDSGTAMIASIAGPSGASVPGDSCQGFAVSVTIDAASPPGTATITVTATNTTDDLCNGTLSKSTSAAATVTVIGIDMDIDSDNDGAIAEPDDPIEEETPGKFVGVNDDDDNLDGSADYTDSGPNIGLNEDDLVPVRLQCDHSPDDPSAASWTLTWTPTTRIRAWENSDKSGQVFVSGTPTPWTAFGGLPPLLYVEGLAPGAVTLTLETDGPEFPADCIDTVRLTVLRISLLRDAGGSLVLDDWAEDPTDGFPRSPRHLLAKEDNIFARVTTEPGLGDGFFSFIVSSDSDAGGVSIKLDEISPGIHQNTESGGELLRLSETTSSGAIDTIRVVEEEVLTFDVRLWPDEQQLGIARDVMVDRAEAAGGGINRFYAAATGDRTLLEQRLWNDAQWWNNGDFDAENTSDADGLTLRSLIKNAGDNAPAAREADFLQASLHGFPNGDLHREGASPTLIIDPDGGAAVGIAAADWNDDLDWVCLAACSQLHDGQACHAATTPTGRLAWANAAFSGTRPLHGILGATCPLHGDLSQPMTRFWERVIDDEEPLITAYGSSMELANPISEENWAALWITNMNYTQDRLTQMGRDANPASIAGFGYLHLENINLLIVCGRTKDTGISWNEGATPVLADVASLDTVPKVLRPSIRLVPTVPSFDPGFPCKVQQRPDYGVEFRGRDFYTDSLGGSTLTEDQVTSLVHRWCVGRVPNFQSEYSLLGVSHVKYHEYNRAFETRAVTTPGYLATYSHEVDGIRILPDTLRVRVVGDHVSSCLVKISAFHQRDTWPVARRTAGCRAAFERATPAICQSIGADPDSLTVLAVELVYWIESAGRGALDTAKPCTAPLAYRVVLSGGECAALSCRTQKWSALIDAVHGRLIEISRF